MVAGYREKRWSQITVREDDEHDYSQDNTVTDLEDGEELVGEKSADAVEPGEDPSGNLLGGRQQ